MSQNTSGTANSIASVLPCSSLSIPTFRQTLPDERSGGSHGAAGRPFKCPYYTDFLSALPLLYHKNTGTYTVKITCIYTVKINSMAFYTAKITRIYTVKINSIFFYTVKITCNLTCIYTVKLSSIPLNIFPFLRRKIRKLCTQFTSC